MSGKKVFLETFGCQMNEYDSLVARTYLEQSGYTFVESSEQANVLLLNTCAVRENAHEKIHNRLTQYGHHKKDKRIGVLGCMPQNLGEELLKTSPAADFLAGPDAYRFLPDIIAESFEKPEGEKTLSLTLSREEIYSDGVPSPALHRSAAKSPISAFVTIQRGCDNFCSFCVVPYTRGRERSRPVSEIVEEVNQLVSAGFRSVVLLGQNVNSYLHDGVDFAGLAREVLASTDIARLYFTSPHPKDYPEELIDLMASEERLASQAHIPLQAGSNRILKDMKRNYTREEYLSLIEKMRQRIPDLAISTDVIVGFPGETDSDFQETLEVMRAADFDTAFMFAYSERRGTIASRRFPDDVPEEVKKKHLAQLISEQNERARRKNEAWIGRRTRAMAESFARRNAEEIYGRLDNGKQVFFPLPENFSMERNKVPGNFFEVEIVRASSATLRGDKAFLLD